jgi:AraC-like DNA-binding protein
MFTFDHLNGPIAIGRYRAPNGQTPQGRAIEPALEEIEFFIDGEGYFEWEGQEHVARCGTVLWHLAGEETLYRNNGDFPYECLTIAFPVRGAPRRQIPKVTHWDDPGEARTFAMELLRLFYREDTDKVRLGQYAYARLLWNAHEYSLRPPASHLPRCVQLTMHQLDTQYSSPLHINAVAAQVGVSTAHLHTLFKAHLGITPYQYLLQRRLQEARHLLASGDQLVKEISYACGFQDVVNFCRCFKARYGMTPATFRAQTIVTR